jgi:SM-20-related protein
MIGNELYPARWRRTLTRHRRVQIPGFLHDQQAFVLYRCLAEQLSWHLAAGGGDRSWISARGAYPDGAAYQKIAMRAQARAEHGHQYLHDCYSPGDSRIEGECSTLVVDAVPEDFNSAEFLGLVRALTGDPAIVRVTAQAIRLRPGQFLLPAAPADDGRRYAYTLHLSPVWRAEWGGLLQSLDDQGGINETFLPRWNALTVLRLPQRHQVTLIAPWAQRPQYAISGCWYTG